MDTNDFANDIVELRDEEDNAVRFEHITTVEFKGEEYAILSPIDQIEGIEEDEVVIMHIRVEEDEDIYEAVEDEAVLDDVFNVFLKQMDEDEELEEEYEDEDEGEEKE